MRYFVTGASGFVGRNLCRILLAQGHCVTAMVRRAGSVGCLRGADIVRASLENPEVYGPMLADCDYVVHLAGDPHYGNGSSYRLANVDNTAKLLKAVRAHASKVRRFVFVSTIGAIDRSPEDTCDNPLMEEMPAYPTSDYGRSKLEAERLVADSGVPYSIVRPAMVVGADMRIDSHVSVFVRAALSKRFLARIRWPGSLSIIHVDDLVSGLIVAALHEKASGRVFFAAGDSIALGEIFDWASPTSWRLPVGWLARALFPLRRLLPFNLKILLYSALTADDAALRGLGWQPKRHGSAIVTEVIEREQARMYPWRPPAGRTVVTGAASGLGRVLAETLAKRHRKLLLVDRDIDRLADTCRGASGVIRIECDFSDEQSIQALLTSEAWTEEPILEIFACAGVGLRGPVSALSSKAQLDIVKVNTIARLQLAQNLLENMRCRQFGRIVLISSSSAYQPLPYMSVYAASNAALLLFGEGLAAEVRADGVEVLTVCPGGMRTQFQRRAGVQELSNEKLMPPEDVADEILASLGKNRVVIMPSMRSKGMALAARLLPRRVSLLLWYHLMKKFR